MKYFLILSVLCLSYYHADCFLADTINGAILAGQFLWDNALNPALQTLQQNGAIFIDTYFGNILNAIPIIGKRSDKTQLILIEKEATKAIYLIQSSELIGELKTVVLKFYQEVKTTLKPFLTEASVNLSNAQLQQTITSVIDKYIKEIKALVEKYKEKVINSLSSKTYPDIDDKFRNGVSDFFNQIGDYVVQGLNVVLSAIFSLFGRK